jgi:hypothetical protein
MIKIIYAVIGIFIVLTTCQDIFEYDQTFDDYVRSISVLIVLFLLWPVWLIATILILIFGWNK